MTTNKKSRPSPSGPILSTHEAIHTDSQGVEKRDNAGMNTRAARSGPGTAYVEINREIALLVRRFADAFSANDAEERASRLVLRAAALQASAHNGKPVIADQLRAIATELDQ